jgi:hypothetical protein
MEGSITVPKQKDPTSIVSSYIKNYGSPTDVMGNIRFLDPQIRRNRLKNWFRARDLESRQSRLNSDDLDRTELGIMNSLGISQDLQDAIVAARMAGASASELTYLVSRYQGE